LPDARTEFDLFVLCAETKRRRQQQAHNKKSFL
jgi:hypothetical protein